jgi:hypothetical protein
LVTDRDDAPSPFRRRKSSEAIYAETVQVRPFMAADEDEL